MSALPVGACGEPPGSLGAGPVQWFGLEKALSFCSGCAWGRDRSSDLGAAKHPTEHAPAGIIRHLEWYETLPILTDFTLPPASFVTAWLRFSAKHQSSSRQQAGVCAEPPLPSPQPGRGWLAPRWAESPRARRAAGPPRVRCRRAGCGWSPGAERGSSGSLCASTRRLPRVPRGRGRTPGSSRCVPGHIPPAPPQPGRSSGPRPPRHPLGYGNTRPCCTPRRPPRRGTGL